MFRFVSGFRVCLLTAVAFGASGCGLLGYWVGDRVTNRDPVDTNGPTVDVPPPDTMAPDPGCEQNEFSGQPGPGDEHPYREPLVLVFPQPSFDLALSLVGPQGELQGSLDTRDGMEWTFRPDEELVRGEQYRVLFSWCGGDLEYLFTAVGDDSPVTDPDGMVGRSYSMDLQNIRVTEPAGVGDLVGGMLNTVLLMQMEAVTDDTVQVHAAWNRLDTPNAQDFCHASMVAPAADFSDPWFTLEMPEWAMQVPLDMPELLGAEFHFEQVRVTGMFEPDGLSWSQGALEGWVDITALDEVAGGQGAACDLVAGFGVECTICPVSGAPTCIEVAADQLQGTEIQVEIERVEQANCHEQCAESAANPDCDME